MRNIKFIVAYDGSNYHGSQIQKNALTVQEKIEDALEILLKKRVRIIFASRTDAGVHAKGQVFNIKVDSSIPIDKFPVALNTNLPVDIVILSAQEVADDFHARYFSSGKTYVYQIYNEEFLSPFFRNYSCHINNKLDLSAMKEAASYLVGEHNFASFRASGCSAETTIRELYSIEIKDEQPLIKFEIKGSGFLYKMIRIIAGTLIEVGKGIREARDVRKILVAKDRLSAGFTAPAKGLFLKQVKY